MKVSYKQEAWAVLIDGKHFALDGHGMRWVRDKRKDAVAFAKELQNHIDAQCQPVKVRLQIEMIE